MGVVVNVRKAFYRVGLWTRSVGKGDNAQKVLLSIGKKFKDTLRLKDTDVIEFSGHTDSAHSGSTRARAKFTV